MCIYTLFLYDELIGYQVWLSPAHLPIHLSGDDLPPLLKATFRLWSSSNSDLLPILEMSQSSSNSNLPILETSWSSSYSGAVPVISDTVALSLHPNASPNSSSESNTKISTSSRGNSKTSASSVPSDPTSAPLPLEYSWKWSGDIAARAACCILGN